MRSLFALAVLTACAADPAPPIGARSEYFDDLVQRAPPAGPSAIVDVQGHEIRLGAGVGAIEIDEDGQRSQAPLPNGAGAVHEIVATPWNGASGYAIAVAAEGGYYWGVAELGAPPRFGAIDVQQRDLHVARIWNPEGDSIHVALASADRRTARYAYVHDCPTPEAPASMTRLYDLADP